eukprot:7298584-Prymnesium_polylepis.1
MLCERAVEELQAKLDGQSRRRPADAAALAAECEMLRGERSSWRLLRELFYDWEGRQQPAPPYPDPPEDWGRRLRALGTPVPPLNAETLAQRERELAQQPPDAKTQYSSLSANAGIEVRSLHDEVVQEEAITRADAVHDMGQRVVRWLEQVARTRRVHIPPPEDARPRETAASLSALLDAKLKRLQEKLKLSQPRLATPSSGSPYSHQNGDYDEALATLREAFRRAGNQTDCADESLLEQARRHQRAYTRHWPTHP